jgi:CRISPR-associated protein Csd1
MILKALYDYYQRSKDLAPKGFEFKEIPFIICIDKEGHFLQLEDMRFDKKKCKEFEVVKTISRSSSPISNVLWDNVEYVLDFTINHLPSNKELTEKERAERQQAIEKSAYKHQLFVNKVHELCDRYPNNIAFQAVLNFYNHEDWKELIKTDRLWQEIERKPTVNLSFRLGNELAIIAEDEDLIDYVQSSLRQTSVDNINYPVCLITGNKAEPVLTSTATMIPGSQATAKLVAFQVNSGYDSFGHSQGVNAPISKEAEFAYTTSLNHLLKRDSLNKYLLGNRVFIFWSSSVNEASKALEQSFYSFMNMYKKEEDDPDRRIEEVRKMLNAVYTGILQNNLTDRFYFLGLAPNSARIAVVYWNECTLREFAGYLLKHFADMEIVGTREEKYSFYYGIDQILHSIAIPKKKVNSFVAIKPCEKVNSFVAIKPCEKLNKDEYISPNLPETVFKSILQGIPYPDTLHQACIRRIRATQTVSITRAAILKGYINRKIERNNYNHLKPIEMALDKENTDLGYLCGRLFAVLEYAQVRSNKINTIRERYMNSASATPSAVFPTLLNLSIHHVEKLEGGAKTFMEKEKEEIINKIPSKGFPAHLDLQEQSCFFVGYYHQLQDLCTSKKDKNVEDE